MTFKACKYCQVTQIQWDTELSAFRESDGKLHDRKRCEGIRNNNGGATSSGPQQQQYQPQQTQQQQTQQTSSVRSDVWLIPKNDWDKVKLDVDKILSHIANNTIQLEHLSEYYGDLLDHVRTLLTVNRKEEAKADAELAYDTDREDGTLNV